MFSLSSTLAMFDFEVLLGTLACLLHAFSELILVNNCGHIFQFRHGNRFFVIIIIAAVLSVTVLQRDFSNVFLNYRFKSEKIRSVAIVVRKY